MVKDRSGHGFSKYAKRLPDFKLTRAQEGLLKRLEEYVVWVGRYTIPNSENDYEKAEADKLKSLRSTDFEAIDQLFQQLSVLLAREYANNPPL